MNLTPNETVSGEKTLLWEKDFNFPEILELPRRWKASKSQEIDVPVSLSLSRSASVFFG